MNTSKAPIFKVIDFVQEDNGIGGKINREKTFKTIRGFLDYLSGDEKTSFNTFMQESTHVLLTDYIKGIKAKMFIEDELKNRYEIILVDDPVSMHHHLEIYLRFIGDRNA